jgi:hypothetical protein
MSVWSFGSSCSLQFEIQRVFNSASKCEIYIHSNEMTSISAVTQTFSLRSFVPRLTNKFGHKISENNIIFNRLRSNTSLERGLFSIR